MPIIWRYLLGQYLKVLGICLFTFIAVLLSTRLDEIARFATLGAGGHLVLSFTLYQIPYILPIALPISCVISSLLLFQQLSQSHQITALRACGLAMRQIASPILFAGGFLALTNFYIVSELATQSHLATRQLQNEIKSLNPMILLQNSHLLKMRGFFVDVLGPSRPGELVSDVVLAMNNGHYKRLNVLLAKSVEADNSQIVGDGVSLITSSLPKDHQGFDHLVVENIESTKTPIDDFTRFLKNEGWRLNVDHLRMSLLLIRTKEAVQALRLASLEEQSPVSMRILNRRVNGCFAEISRRFSMGLAAFCFTLLGTSFGMVIGRRQSKRGVLYVIALTALYLACFFMAKSLDHLFFPPTALYLAPLSLITVMSIWQLKRVTRGIE